MQPVAKITLDTLPVARGLWVFGFQTDVRIVNTRLRLWEGDDYG
jgi:hypothetical protein